MCVDVVHVLVSFVQFLNNNESKATTKVCAFVCLCVCVCVRECVCACVCGTSTTVFIILSRLSGYGSINIGLPPASPSNEEVEGVSECRS